MTDQRFVAFMYCDETHSTINNAKILRWRVELSQNIVLKLLIVLVNTMGQLTHYREYIVLTYRMRHCMIFILPCATRV